MKPQSLKGVFTEILESKDKKSAFEIFINQDVSLKNINNNNPDDDCKLIRKEVYNKYIEAIKQYKDLVTNLNNVELFTLLRDLEIYISQARSILETNTKLSEVNQKRGGSETSYVVARAPFYIPENVKAEIRVYLGKKEELGKKMEDLSEDTVFMDNAEKQLVMAMNEILTNSIIDIDLSKTNKI
jgi:hypothetical protein